MNAGAASWLIGVAVVGFFCLLKAAGEFRRWTRDGGFRIWRRELRSEHLLFWTNQPEHGAIGYTVHAVVNHREANWTVTRVEQDAETKWSVWGREAQDVAQLEDKP